MDEHHELVLPENDGAQAGLCRLECEHTEIEAALRDFRADLPSGNAAHVHVNQRMRLPEPRDEGQHCVHRRFVRADEDPPTSQVAQILDGSLGLLRQAEQALGVVPEKAPGLGQGRVLGGPVEEALPDALLQAADRLADCRLSPV